MNRSAGAASNPASAAANINFGASSASTRGFNRSGPPANSAASHAQANATQFGFSGVSVAQYGDTVRSGPASRSDADNFSFRRLESSEESSPGPRMTGQYGLRTGLSRLDSSQASSGESPNVARQRLNKRLSSTFDFETEFEAEHIEDLRQGQIAYPRGQPRSQSFLQSQRYPDADLHAETQSVRL
ncbi:1,3-beta-glucan synthase component [Phytophthora boehmeriae]|uniref:1,3-beta-glucan synthase component n=1 Tax=Phytophthora boehmeriae TaxID=109152 RepID=A0A8T1WYF0_9STRA|nr:1,3-beta-glucan synthase component [Phytophthora boehmeriae]